MLDTTRGENTDHFAFGENWASYATLIGDREIEEAKRGLLKLMPADEIRGRSFLDIGCGSGLHSLAALKLGASRVVAVDIDPNSVRTAAALLKHHAGSSRWDTVWLSVLDPDLSRLGTFEIVYSWGVLHHTGAMWSAVHGATACVTSEGLFAFALYRATRMDGFWKREKRWYAHASPLGQRTARAIYLSAFRLLYAMKGINYRDYVANYRSMRGMDFRHDVHDWLGGHPYETARADEVDRTMVELGFKSERVFVTPMTRGLLGSGCDEYVYRRVLPQIERHP